jgi:hypothetical protein
VSAQMQAYMDAIARWKWSLNNYVNPFS